MQMAPELIMGRPCTSKVDIFSFGTLLHEICSGGQAAAEDGWGRAPLVYLPAREPAAVRQAGLHATGSIAACHCLAHA